MNERDIFLAAIELKSTEERQTYLQSACVDDSGLMARVEALISSHEKQSQFLNTPVVEQITEDSPDNVEATTLGTEGSTQDEEEDTFDEIPLGYLQPSTKPDSLGRLGHYEIIEVVGRGAFGIVLKAFDEKLQRVVAIKVLSSEFASTSPARKRFLREARTSAAIRHDNVVSVYAVEDDPIPYLVMEYVPGITLQQRLDEHGPLDLNNVLRLGKQIADGLAAAHGKQLIHRDVKPGNILLESSIDDHVKITDFGLARAVDDASLTQTGVIAGTPLYMAPEQALGHKLDQRADLFSLGSVLYQMLSGRPPFRASTTLAVLKRVTEDTPRPISDIIPEIPDWMCEIITKLHAKNPDDRYASAKEVSDILQTCLTDLKQGRKSVVATGQSTVMHSPAASKSSGSGDAKRSKNRLLPIAIALLLIPFAVYGSTLFFGETTSSSAMNHHAQWDSFAEDDNVQKAGLSKVPTDSSPAETLPVAIAPFDSEQASEYQKAWAKHLGVSVEKEIILGQDKDGKDVVLTMVLIPPGEFLMGTNDTERKRWQEEEQKDDSTKKVNWLGFEGPPRWVKITQPFWLSRHEFTNGQFRRFVESTGFKTEVEQNGEGGIGFISPGKISRDPLFNWDGQKWYLSRGDHHPVVNVSWNDTKACCEWLSKQQADMTFSLPTEAQWEYSCRAGTTTPWCCGENSDDLEQYSWHGENSAHPHRVGQLRPNGFGLYDMHGNVWEWCADWMAPYGKLLRQDPTGPTEGKYRVHRGGNGISMDISLTRGAMCRSAVRRGVVPETTFLDRGFRVAASLKDE